MCTHAELLRRDDERLKRIELNKSRLFGDSNQLRLIPSLELRPGSVELIHELRALSEQLPQNDLRDKDVLVYLIKEKPPDSPANASDLLSHTLPVFAVRMQIRCNHNATSQRDLLSLGYNTASVLSAIRSELDLALNTRKDLAGQCDVVVRITYPDGGSEEDEQAAQRELRETGILSDSSRWDNLCEGGPDEGQQHRTQRTTLEHRQAKLHSNGALTSPFCRLFCYGQCAA